MHTLEDCAAEIVGKVKAASMARVERVVSTASPSAATERASGKKSGAGLSYSTTDKVIAIGASTGGTEAIKEVLVRLRSDCPGIVITQHIPPVFSRSFAERMDQTCQLAVCEAENGQQIRTGHAYIAPGDQHLSVVKDGAKYVCRLDSNPPVNRHRPAVDVLFDSVAQAAGKNAVGVILTGMGRDGAVGMKHMHNAGAATIAQDEASSVIFGMPHAAIEEGGVDKVLPLDNIAAAMTHLASG